MGIIAWLVIGGIAGFLAGKVMKGKGFGLFGNIGVGIVGAILGGWVLGLLGLGGDGMIASLVTAFGGACLLLFIVDKVKK